MKRIAFFTAAVFFAAALPLAAQVNDTYVIPAVGNTYGINTHWQTSLSIFNPQTQYPLTVSLVFLPTGGEKPLEVLIDIPKNGAWSSDNVLFDAFGKGGTGSLLAATFPEDNPGVPNDVLSRSFLIVANTYNDAGPNGTYGQTIPGVWTGLQDIDTDGISSIAHNIRNNDRIAYRTNIGAVNLGRCDVTLYVTAYDEDGNTVLKNAPFVIPPMGHLQDRLPVTIDRGTVEFYVDDPCANDANNYAVVFPYTSTIDNLSGDPSYQSPVLLASPNVLFKKGVTDAASIGKKIDLSFARRARGTAVSLGRLAAKK